jgi:hypothetical protein
LLAAGAEGQARADLIRPAGHRERHRAVEPDARKHQRDQSKPRGQLGQKSLPREFYDLMWSTVLETAADWVIITTWNEWFEYTAIEPGEKDGTLMLDRTRFWTAEFKRRTSEVEPRDPRDPR